MGIIYGTSTPVTITLNGLASAAARESTALSMATLTPNDCMVTIKFMTGTATGPDNTVYVYKTASEDGTNYDYPATGSDAGVTTTPPLQMIAAKSVGILTNTAFVIYVDSLMSNGKVPLKWGICVDNRAGQFNNTPANFSITFTPIYFN